MELANNASVKEIHVIGGQVSSHSRGEWFLVR